MRCNKELPRRQYEQYGERRTTPLQPLENCSKALINPNAAALLKHTSGLPAQASVATGARRRAQSSRHYPYKIQHQDKKPQKHAFAPLAQAERAIAGLRPRRPRPLNASNPSAPAPAPIRNEYLNHRFNKTAGKIGFFPRGQQTACAANMGGYSRLQSAKTEIQILGMQHWTRQCDDPARARFSEL